LPGSSRDAARSAQDTRDELRDTTRDATRGAREQFQDTRDAARDTLRDTRQEFRDTTREATRDAQDQLRDTRDQFRDTRDSTRQQFDDRRESFRDDRDFSRTDRDFSRDQREEFRGQRDQPREQFDRESFRDSRTDLRSDVQTRDSFRDTRANVDFRADNIRAADIGLWFNRGTANGLIISDIGTNSAITRFGFREGDRILAVNGWRVANESQFVEYLFDPQLRNQRVEVIAWRNGQQVPIWVEPWVLVQEYTTVQADPLEQYGLVLDDRYQDYIVVWKVLPRSPAFYAGIRPGDVIVSWSGRHINRPQEFVTLVQQGNWSGPIDLQVSRNRQLRALQLDMGQVSARTALRPNLDVDAAGNVDVDRALPGRENRIENRIERRDDRRDLRSDGTYGTIEGTTTIQPGTTLQPVPGVQIQPAPGVQVQPMPARPGLFRGRGR
jgi:C-terminal processing protease CtpA/Prc